MIERLEAARNSIPKCNPPFWASTGHLQTILAHLIPSPKVMERGEHLNITLEIATERIHSTYLKGTTNTVVYLFHGLGGSIQSNYVQRTALVARSLGHHVFMNNHRGCGDGAGLAVEPYHSGRAEDLSKVIEYGRNMLPGHKHIAIGFSLSANALLLLAAKVRASVQPDMAIAVNAPINLDRASIKLQEGLNRIYDKRFVLDLKQYMERNRPDDIGDYSLVKDLRDFDARYTAPIGGFKDRNDYYETCSAKQYLRDINIPTVVMTAVDDPFVSAEDYLEATYSPMCVRHIEKVGGHVGYLQQHGLGYKRWLDMALETYIKQL